MYSKGSGGPWIRLENISKFSFIMGSLFIKVSQQDPPDTNFPETVTWMNGNTAKFEIEFYEMIKPNKTNTLNKIFGSLNYIKAMNYSSFSK